MKNFTGQYNLDKTVCFELIPQGSTLKKIEDNGIIEQDQKRHDDSHDVKNFIDIYHKKFINDTLENFELNSNLLKDYIALYKQENRSDEQKNMFEDIKNNLRKQIADQFKNNPIFNRLFSKDLIKTDLLNSNIFNESDKLKISEFKSFTTYFDGFHENRKNMYTDEDKSSSIAYRLINQNLPKFIFNMNVFEKIRISPLVNKFPTILSELENILQVNDIREMFEENYFNKTLTQRGIDIYNTLLGGYTLDENTPKIKGLNEYINLYNQQQTDKRNKIPQLKELWKQILSDKLTASFIQKKYSNDDELLEDIEKFYQNINNNLFENDQLINLLSNLNNFDSSGIYIKNDTSLTTISQYLFNDWSIIERCLKNDFETKNIRKVRESEEKYNERKENFIKKTDSFSVSYLNSVIKLAYNNKLIEVDNAIENYFINNLTSENNKLSQIKSFYKKVVDLLNTQYPIDKNLSQDNINIEKIKSLLDSINNLLWLLKPLNGSGDELNKDDNFYNEFDKLYKNLSSITPLYNKVRDFITTKPYSKEKIQLFFKNKGQFLGGWVDSKTENSDNGTQAGGYLFKSLNSIGEYDYFLGISADTHLFRDNENNQNKNCKYQRLNYYQPKSASIYGNSYIGGKYDDDKDTLISVINIFVNRLNNNIREEILFQFSRLKGDSKTPSGLFNILKINFPEQFKELLKFDLFIYENHRITTNLHNTILSLNRIPKSKEYRNVNFETFVDAQNAIENICKERVFNYFPVSDEEMEEVCNRKNKPLYLFKISNSDLSFADTFSKGLRKSRGIKKRDTLLFEALMGGNQNIIDIGTGQIFFRKGSLVWNERQMQFGHHYDELKDKFTYPIISKKRYTYDKFLFHMSMKINYQQPENIKNFNTKINEYLFKSSNYIIGIDRGERHLIYVSVIDKTGKIIKQYSLNEIINEYNGREIKTNYQEKLNQKEEDRDSARKNWITIDSIKDLKDGYLSQVIYKISQLVLKYNAIVVLEDLNDGFVNSRKRVEKQVYQKFEKMLIDKFNYLVDKKDGDILKGCQLTTKFDSFQKMKFQNGILFYVPARYTSKLDPTTGFVNLLPLKYESKPESEKIINKFDKISYNEQENQFEFSFNYNNFHKKCEGIEKQWTVCLNNEIRYQWNRRLNNNKGGQEPINIFQKLSELFIINGIRFQNGDNLINQITQKNSSDLYKELFRLLKLTCDMRFFDGTTDFMLSPVKNNMNNFYDSRLVSDDSLPNNPDANGAYNIARKGLMLMNNLEEFGVNQFNKHNYIHTNDWFKFIQK